MQPYEKLESELAAWSGMEHVVVCSSGTAALHLALEAMGMIGSRVLMSDFNMIALPRAAVLAGMRPCFADCDERMLLPAELPDAEFAAVMAVHIYGRRCNMDAVHAWAGPRCCRVVEDLAEAHGVRPHPLTDAAVWSFYRNKVVHGEEGGAVAFRERRHSDLARSLRSMGFTAAHDFMHIPRGHNYRMSNVHADLIRVSLGGFDEEVARRRRAEMMFEALVPSKLPPRDVPWVYDVLVPAEKQAALVASVPDARHAFKPMSSQPEFKYNLRCGGYNTQRFSQTVVYFPLDVRCIPLVAEVMK